MQNIESVQRTVSCFIVKYDIIFLIYDCNEADKIDKERSNIHG